MDSRSPHGTAESRSLYYRCVLGMDGDLTTVTIGPVSITASGRAVDDDRAPRFTCNATARFTRPNAALPPPLAYFIDLDHARRFAANSNGLWQADPTILRTPQACEYRLVRERTALPVAAGAPLFFVDVDHLVHLAAYWFDVTLKDARPAAPEEGR